MQGLLILSTVIGLLVLLVGWRFVHQIKRKRLLSGLLWSAQGAVMFLSFLVVLLVYSNLHSYQRLTYEENIADVYIRKIQPQKFQLSLSFSKDEHDQHYFQMDGDQWQLDAHILKWKGWANLIGLDSYYRLKRLSGRFQDIEQARVQIASQHDLSKPMRGLDIWKLKQVARDNMGFVDTLFGQSVFMPMADGAHYRVSVGQSGLLVRPINEKARQAAL